MRTRTSGTCPAGTSPDHPVNTKPRAAAAPTSSGVPAAYHPLAAPVTPARLGLRGERPPVVYVTGSVDARTAVQAIKAGADDYVIKEASGEFFELLIAAVAHALERWRLRRLKAESEKGQIRMFVVI